MTFINTGWLIARANKRDRTIEILKRPNPDLADAGCLLYEVGASSDNDDKVLVVEMWESAEAHSASLSLPSVRAAIGDAMPLLTGEMGGDRFTTLGSPLRA